MQMNLHEPFVFSSWEALIFWGVFIWVFAPEMRITTRAMSATSKAQDAGSAYLISIANGLAIFAAFIISFLPWFRIPHPHIAFYVGTALLAAGSLLRRWCWRMLGKYFTGAVAVVSDQPVVDRGPYRWVRHPSYTGGIAMLIGIGVALGSWVVVALFAVVTSCIYSYRVKVEEKALLATLGEPYRAYMQRTKRFIPFVT